MDDWKSRKLAVQGGRAGQSLPARGTPCLVLVYAGALDSAEVGRRFDLLGEELIIGRSSDADIQVDRDSVSRRHARLAQKDGGWSVSDLQSTNGSYINDMPIREHRLQDGELLKIGNAIFKFLDGHNVEAAFQDELYRVAITDGLTQAYNRRYFVESLERDVARASHYARPLGLLLVDIDNCKVINDNHGHLTGDHIIKELGRRIQGRMDRAEALCRYEGTQFILMLPECTPEQATARAEQLRHLVQAETFNFEGERIAVTVSIGVACLDQEPDAPAFLRTAHENMQRAKRQGKNRVVG